MMTIPVSVAGGGPILAAVAADVKNFGACFGQPRFLQRISAINANTTTTAAADPAAAAAALLCPAAGESGAGAGDEAAHSATPETTEPDAFVNDPAAKIPPRDVTATDATEPPVRPDPIGKNIPRDSTATFVVAGS